MTCGLKFLDLLDGHFKVRLTLLPVDLCLVQLRAGWRRLNTRFGRLFFISALRLRLRTIDQDADFCKESDSLCPQMLAQHPSHTVNWRSSQVEYQRPGVIFVCLRLSAAGLHQAAVSLCRPHQAFGIASRMNG